jgi:MYXO-CTERM domain-containing protein
VNSQKPFYSVTSRSFGVTAVITLMAALLSTASVKAEERVIVVFVGSNLRAPVYGLVEDGDHLTAQAITERVLLGRSSSGTTFSDIRILPSGHALLADANQRGFAVTNGDGDVLVQLGGAGSVPSITSAAVVAYADGRLPARVLLTDNGTGRAQIYDLTERRYVWHQPFTLMGLRGQLTTAIWLPGDRAAVAVNWPALGISAIDVLLTRAGEDWRPRRFTNVAHQEGPIEQIVVKELESIRDVMAYGADNLLVTTRHSLMALGPDGTVLWQIESGQLPQLSGEFASGRWLPSGQVALATFEPGYWTYPHPNHRVHWFDVQEGRPRWVAATEPLDAAPARLDAAVGQGGTGSFDYYADLDGERGSADDIATLDALRFDAASYLPGKEVEFTATLRNGGPTAVRLDRLFVVLAPDVGDGSCEAVDVARRIELWQRVPMLIEGQGFFVLRARSQLEPPMTPGVWCGALLSHDAMMTERVHGPMAPVQILRSGSTSTIVVRDLGGPGNGNDDDTAEPVPGGFDELDSGCACTSVATGSGPSGLSVLGLLVLLGLGQRRRR